MRRVDARAHSLPRAVRRISDVEDPFAEALASEFTGPSVARSYVADSEVAPQWSALVACRRLP